MSAMITITTKKPTLRPPSAVRLHGRGVRPVGRCHMPRYDHSRMAKQEISAEPCGGWLADRRRRESALLDLHGELLHEEHRGRGLAEALGLERSGDVLFV